MNAWQKNWQLSLVGMGLMIIVGACSTTETQTLVDDSSASLSSSVAQESETPATPQISFYDAVAIAEAEVDGKVYMVELEKEDERPIIEIEIHEQEVIVDAETGEVIAIDNLLETDDPEDVESVTKALNLQQFDIIPIQDALKIAETASGKTAHTIALENEDGNLVYEVAIGLEEIYVDAGNGEILFTEKSSQSDDIGDVESSIQVPFDEDDD